MITAFGDDLKLRKIGNNIDNDIALVILINNSIKEHVVPLELGKLEKAGDLHCLSLYLTRCAYSEKYHSIFKHEPKNKVYFGIGTTIEDVSLLALPEININSSKEEAELYLSTLVRNINIVALAVHDLVPQVESNTEWLDVD